MRNLWFKISECYLSTLSNNAILDDSYGLAVSQWLNGAKFWPSLQQSDCIYSTYLPETPSIYIKEKFTSKELAMRAQNPIHTS